MKEMCLTFLLEALSTLNSPVTRVLLNFTNPHPGTRISLFFCFTQILNTFYTVSSGDAGYTVTNQDVCPGQPMSEYHTNGINDLGGCALAIAYNDDANNVQPDDFVVFSVNYTCVWTLHTSFSVPSELPACPNGKCTCIWTWIHTVSSLGWLEQRLKF